MKPRPEAHNELFHSLRINAIWSRFCFAFKSSTEDLIAVQICRIGFNGDDLVIGSCSDLKTDIVKLITQYHAKVMEWTGSERTLSSQSEQSSLLDLSCNVTPESFLLKSNPGKDDLPPSPEVDAGYFLTESSSQLFPGLAAKANITLWPCLHERAEPTSCKNTEHLQPSAIGVHEQREEGESTLRKSLDTFYSTWCQKKLFGGSPIYESTSQCLSRKTADLAGKEGMKFTVKSLQIAQMVLNREENKIFPQPPSNHVCFLTPVNAGAGSEKGKAIPGLSDDILQFILKQNVTK